MSEEIKTLTIRKLRRYEVTSDAKSLGIYLMTVLPVVALIGAGAWAAQWSLWYAALFAAPIAIFLCRCFVVEHDCGHESFFTKKRYNRTGAAIVGFFTMIPSAIWIRIHNTHHELLGNLDERHVNPEMWTMTVEEYRKCTPGKQRLYRFVRSRFMRLIITPMIWMVVARIPFTKFGTKILVNILVHDVLYAILLWYIHINGWWPEFLVLYVIPLYLFNFAASVMFYLQHQFEHTSWEYKEDWDFFTASIHGSSYVDLGPFLRWLTGNVGCHHVHHLNTRIPCYKIREATEDVDSILKMPRIHFSDMMKHFDCVLWDEDSKKLIRFSDLKK